MLQEVLISQVEALLRVMQQKHHLRQVKKAAEIFQQKLIRVCKVVYLSNKQAY